MLTKSPIVTGNLLSEDEEGNIPTMPDDPATIFLDGKVIEKQPFESMKQKKLNEILNPLFILSMGQVLIQCAFGPVFFIFTQAAYY